MKYKPCCNARCLVGGCKTQESGGCYCLCRLKDAEQTCLRLLSGECYRFGPGIIYKPGRIATPLEGDEKEKTECELYEIRERIKTYEIGK